MNMLFLIHFEITPEARDKALKRLKASVKWETPGVKLLLGHGTRLPSWKAGV